MAIVYYNTRGSWDGGGPSIHVAKMTQGLVRVGHKVIFDKPESAAVAVCIINTGKILKKIDRTKTKVFLRVDGIYNKVYNEKFKRAVRPDMSALHAELLRDIPLVDGVIYQSKWSRDRVWDEIVKVEKNYTIISNGANLDVFKPVQRSKGKVINLLHVGKMRDAYLMEILIGVYNETKRRGLKTNLLLAGNMDAACSGVFKKYSDSGIKYFGPISNPKLPQIYQQGDIFLNIRQGCSSNNVVSEAQASGLPVIASSWGGDCEMISDNNSGIIVDGGIWDYDKRYINNLTDAVEKIIPDLDNFKIRSRTHAVNELGTDKMISKYLKIMGL